MNTTALLLLSGVGIAAAIECWLRHTNPWRLWKDSFDEASVMIPHVRRGWAQKPNHKFKFHHRYLKTPIDINLNSLGMHDHNEYQKEKPTNTFRILLMGGTTSSGWELNARDTQAAKLQQKLAELLPERNVEVINASARLYCTSQLYNWYVEELADYDADIVIYYFNINHPRRSLSIHESGKSTVLSQPIYIEQENGELELTTLKKATHPNDMIYLNEENQVVHIEGTTGSSLYKKLRDRSHLLTAIDDISQGKIRLRKFHDRKEIKDIELQHFKPGAPKTLNDLPYQWQTIAKLLKMWSSAVKNNNGKFIVFSHLAYYCIKDNGLFSDERKHQWGFLFEEIPERRYMPFIANREHFEYFDTFKYARAAKVDLDAMSIHPRYAYLNADGADFHAKGLCEAISPHLHR